jgi:hypothetical protein
MATQYLIGEDGARLPEGIVVAHTLHGEPHPNVTNAYAIGDVIPVGDDGIGWIGDQAVQLAPEKSPAVEAQPEPVSEPETVRPTERDKRCIAKGDTCMGWAMKDSQYCAAHAGRLNPHVRVP